MAKNNDIVVSLDLGTTKICSLVGKLNNGALDIVGVGSHPSGGIKRGVIIDIDSTVDAMKKAVTEAELMSGYKITNVYVGISGSHIQSSNEEGQYSLKGQPVTQKDIDKAVELAQSARVVEANRKLIHVEKRDFIVDGEKDIKNPLGIPGHRLESRVHVVTASIASVDNIRRCVEGQGLRINDIILESIASSCAVLTEEEKELGVVLLDIGGGTCDMSIFFEGSIVYSAVIPIGGSNITQDISYCMRTSPAVAEEFKKNHGYALARMVSKDEFIDIPLVGGKTAQQIPKGALAEIIEDRMEQLFNFVAEEIRKSGYADHVSSGIVMTGGTSLLRGIKESAEIFFDVPVRLGRPVNFGVLKNIVSNPIYSTAVGLIMYAVKRDLSDDGYLVVKGSNLYNRVKNQVRGIYKRIEKEYF
ncbi:MAG: cell division protein FtsA [Pseudomonadota bacterium]